MADDVLDPKDLQDGEAKKAVALLYDQVRAPVLVAKGQGAFAEEIEIHKYREDSVYWILTCKLFFVFIDNFVYFAKKAREIQIMPRLHVVIKHRKNHVKTNFSDFQGFS